MRSRSHGRWLLAGAVIAAVFLSGSGGLLPQPPAALAAGKEVCRDCHEKVAASFDSSFHAKAWQGLGKAGGCMDCHGDAAVHQKDPGRATIFSFGKKAKQTPAEQTERCLSCHSASANLAMWAMGKHSQNDVGCTDCHNIHTPKNVVAQPETCNGCHRDIRAQINKQSHHPIEEGKVSCSDCHNPHGSMTERMIKADTINQLCYGCHAEKRGPFVRMHQPVEENCAICHTPHGSRYDKLMTQRIPNLCQDCHADSGHHDDAYDAKGAFTGSAPSSRFYARGCLNCHSLIHGSTHFEQVGLTR